MASGDVLKTIGEVDNSSEIGKISSFGHETVDPLKYLVCEGTDVSRITYAKLFEKIGESFGAGDGSTTFGLPNLIDQFLRGTDGIRVIGDAQLDEVKPHAHSIQMYGIGGGTGTGVAYTGGGANYGTRSSYENTGAETRPKNIAVKFYIRYEG